MVQKLTSILDDRAREILHLRKQEPRFAVGFGSHFERLDQRGDTGANFRL